MSDHAKSILEWVGLNIASWTVVLTPAETLPIRDGIELGIKIAVGVTVVALNVYKIVDIRNKRKA